MKFFAQTAAHINDLAAAEAQQAGAQQIKIVPGGVQFTGDLEVGYRFTLWTRVSSRVLLQLEPSRPNREQQNVKDKDSLYDAAAAIPWSEHMHKDMTFAVTTTARQAGWLKNNQFGSVRVKDAIVDHMRHLFHERPDVDSENPDVLFHLHINGTQALFYLDFSGQGLHKRGYRKHQGEAVLKEHLAAAMVLRSGWKGPDPQYDLLLDPFCGMGTIPIEAALIASDTAPGLLDPDKFGFFKWPKHAPQTWGALLEEAQGRRRTATPPIHGWDIDEQSLEYAREHAVNAGVDKLITFSGQNFTKIVGEPFPDKKGLLVADPPYGMRMGNTKDLIHLYRRTGELLPGSFPGWDAALLCGSSDLMEELRLRPSSVSTLHNGPIPCSFARYEIFDRETREELERKAEEKRQERISSPLSEKAQMCQNRLLKNKKQLKNYLKDNHITSYRLYDADMPEYAAAVDVYEDRWVHVQEYAAPAEIPEERAIAHLNELIDAINRATEIDYDQIFVKQRRRQKGKNQYGKLAAKGSKFIMRENGLKFLVNFTDYLDTGIFLDHRVTRGMIKDMSAKTRFLNLFCYTGTATVHAAAGGALSTVSIDTSGTYLNWAKENMELNGYGGMNHFFYKEDCIGWLKSNRDKFDLIFLDPPTFSNSKSRKDEFDIQRDHQLLIKLAMNHLTTEGTLIFSNNFKKFVLDRYVENRYQVEEITEKTVPADFSRNRIHRCWTIRPKRIISDKNRKQQEPKSPARKIVIRKKK